MSKRLSSKPTQYLIDASNFARRFPGGGPFSPDLAEAEFLGWIEDLAGLPAFASSGFRVYYDGPFRELGFPVKPPVSVTFNEGRTADEALLETGEFLLSCGVRAVLVTSDRGLQSAAGVRGVGWLSCEDFFGMCRAELRRESR
ncbi:MAG TPA: hypothetical protein DDW67_01610 [Elusimicrobia bacterium]|nr:hypothetical protein [Elusimicrobiota bacterium]